MVKIDGMRQREKAAEKPRKKVVEVKYRVEGNDIFILSGIYVGKTVRELWVQGRAERDYIVKYIWFRGDAEVAAIIKELSCQ